MVKLIRFLFVLGVVVAILGTGFAGLTVWYFSRDLPNYKQLAHYQPPIVTRVEAGDGRLLAEYATQRRIFEPIRAIPKLVIDAFLAAEDKNFYSHNGIDPLSILRAAITDIGRLSENRRPIGASTITQQVAKNMLLSNKLSIKRKIREILLAMRIDNALPKDRILELYLNDIYLGDGAYGVAAAALTYFDASLDQLSVAQAAFLGGLPKAPSRYDPQRHPQEAKARRDWVIDRMRDDGFITAAEAQTAKAQPIVLHHREAAQRASAPYFAEEVRRELLARYGDKKLYEGGLSVRTSLDPALQRAAAAALRAGLVRYDRHHGGWRGALTQIDPKGDWRARLAAVPVPPVVDGVGWRLAVVLHTERHAAAIGFADGSTGEIPFEQMRWARPRLANDRLGSRPHRPADVVKPGDVVMVAPLDWPAALDKTAAPAGKKSAKDKKDKHSATAGRNHEFQLCQVPKVEGGLVALDPHTGRVLALSGGFSFAVSQFDRAIQAQRQTGSAIKPFVYLTALDHGFTPSTLVLDAPVSLVQGPGLPLWSPTNYAHEYRGVVPLTTGLVHSLNALTARVAAIVGMDAIARTIERFGIIDHVPREYSMALGAGDTSLLRLTAAYGMLDNGGKWITPTLIDSVQNRDGDIVYRADRRSCPECNHVDWHDQPVPVIPDTRAEVADSGTAYQIVSMLQQVVQRGTGRAVLAVGRPIAGKTGTTNDFRDAWFVGFTPNLVAGVYIGFDEPKTLGRGEQAAVVSAPVFRDFMIAALKGRPVAEFHTPPGIRLYRVDPYTGLPAHGGEPSAYWPFKPGTAPNQNRDFALREMPAGASAPAAGAATTYDQTDEPAAADQQDVAQHPLDRGVDEQAAQGQGMPAAGSQAGEAPPPGTQAGPSSPQLPSGSAASGYPGGGPQPPTPTGFTSAASGLPPAPSSSSVQPGAGSSGAATRGTMTPLTNTGPAGGTGGLY